MVVVSYGITSRIAERAIQQARDAGIKVGSFRIITAWPFPEKEILRALQEGEGVRRPELNLGQMVLEVQRIVEGRPLIPVPHVGGTVHDPQVITNAIVGAVR